jgi:DNA-binding PadR family transcriptional regulator
MSRMISNAENDALYDKLSQELRRGVLILAALSQLDEEKYGYALISQLAERGLQIDQGTLYPLLRRLESQGLLDSSWNTSGSRPRRYYVLNDDGRALMARLSQDWRALADVVTQMVSPQPPEA